MKWSWCLRAGYRKVYHWYDHALIACGMAPEGTSILSPHSTPAYLGLEYISPQWLNRLALVFRPFSGGRTAILYFAQTLDLPPRPAASLLHGPFTRVDVNYRYDNAMPGTSYSSRFTITWAPTIARIVAAINGSARIFVPVGPGGTVISSQWVRLSFVRADGGARKVFVGGDLFQIVVGKTRPLVDTNGRILKLLVKIAHRRCPRSSPCGAPQ